MAVELDKAAILENFMDDEELLFESIDLFLERVESRVEALAGGVAAKNPETVMVEAHTLKGMIGIFYTGSTFESAKDLEMMGREKKLDGVESGFQVFRDDLDALVESLKQWRQSA